MKLLLAMVLMMTGTAAVAQTSTGSGANAGRVRLLQPGLQVLSDTMGVDFTDYLRHAYGDVHENWTATIPKEAQASQLKNSVIWIRFTILPDGSIGTMKLEAKSGDMDLDKAAWLAITSEGKFPTLPADFHGPNLELCVAFLYNTPTPATEERPTRAS